ncbi:hypothetical protein AURDEDRAFT_175140 [Auricularia subglabra TFB-10046 SS5]|nr:hypothetical protein AURDEDRAFT_175140 [Auricularia subglabra TFB-10046 SS5]
MTFNGTEVYVFCVLVNNIDITIQDTRLQFHLDGAPVGSFFHQADLTTSTYLYNQLVFQSQSLPLEEHMLEVINTATEDQTRGSLVLFDYVIYTIGAIVGGIVGGVVALAAVLIILWRLIKSRRHGHAVPSKLEMTARPLDEHVGFSADRQASSAAYTQHMWGSPSSPAFSPPSGSASLSLAEDDRAESRRSLRKPALVMDAGSEAARTVSVYELQDEMGKIRSELEMLKTTSVPPQYAD